MNERKYLNQNNFISENHSVFYTMKTNSIFYFSSVNELYFCLSEYNYQSASMNENKSSFILNKKLHIP